MDFQRFSLVFLYKTGLGRFFLKILTKPQISVFFARYMDSPASTIWITPFIKKHHIVLSDYVSKRYESFNDFFTRKIKPNKRPIDKEATHFISPCDGKLTVYPLNEKSRFLIKGSYYSVTDLTNDSQMEKVFHGGYCFIFRLTVDDYHRYCYMDDGTKDGNVFIPGILHTVNPISLSTCNIYGKNCREYSILHTKNFGDVLQVEVGAMLVGRITNHHEKHQFARGEEKGMFEFGGSTIVLLTKKGSVKPKPELLQQTSLGKETTVKMGECISTQTF